MTGIARGQWMCISTVVAMRGMFFGMRKRSAKHRASGLMKTDIAAAIAAAAAAAAAAAYRQKTWIGIKDVSNGKTPCVQNKRGFIRIQWGAAFGSNETRPMNPKLRSTRAHQ